MFFKCCENSFNRFFWSNCTFSCETPHGSGPDHTTQGNSHHIRLPVPIAGIASVLAILSSQRLKTFPRDDVMSAGPSGPTIWAMCLHLRSPPLVITTPPAFRGAGQVQQQQQINSCTRIIRHLLSIVSKQAFPSHVFKNHCDYVFCCCSLCHRTTICICARYPFL